MQNQRIIINTLGRVEQELKQIKKLLIKSLPAYGSDEWWEKEISVGQRQIKKGQLKVYKNASSMIADLNKGK